MSRDLKLLDRLTDLMVEDLLAMSDEELEAEIREQGYDPAAVAAEARRIFDEVMQRRGEREPQG